jgi:hypothetical protein
MRIIISNIFGAKYEEKIGQLRLGDEVRLARADDDVGVRRWNDAKGKMRFAFPPYGPKAMLGYNSFVILIS